MFRHFDIFTAGLAEISRKIVRIIPTMVYPENSIQTTISAYGLADGFAYNRYNQEQRLLVAKLATAVANAIASLSQATISQRAISFSSLLVSQGVVLAPGYPNEANYEIVKAILAAGEQVGLDMKAPWGSQIVIGRFNQPVESGGRINRLVELIQNQDIDIISRPISIDVVDNTADGEQFVCTTHASFSL